MIPEHLLRYHLQHNHFPPLPESFVWVAQTAIELAQQGDWETWISAPAGFTRDAWRVWEVVAGLHLDGFIDRGAEDDDDDAV